MKVYPNDTDDGMELELEPFGDSAVDIVSFSYPSSWSDKDVLAALDLAEADLTEHGDEVKNIQMWKYRYAH